MLQQSAIRDERAGAGFRVVEVAYAPALERRRTDCPDFQLWWSVAGGWTCERRGLVSELRAGEAALYRPGEPCRQRVAPSGARLLSVQIPTHQLEARQRIRSVGLSVMLARVYQGLVEGEGELEEAVLGLIETEMPSETRTPRWLRQVHTELTQSFCAPRSLTALAASAHVHPAYLVSAFKQRYGVTMGAYLRQLRVEAALHALSQTDDDLATIAQQAGFYDQAHLTRQFRSAVGTSPARFRRSLRPQDLYFP